MRLSLHGLAKRPELKKGKIYLEGNADLLEKQIDNLTGKKGSRIAYFSDQYLNDAIYLEHRDRWDGICVMEELGGVEFGDDVEREIWGDFLLMRILIWKKQQDFDGRL
jgi:hypothetical protein